MDGILNQSDQEGETTNKRNLGSYLYPSSTAFALLQKKDPPKEGSFQFDTRPEVSCSLCTRVREGRSTCTINELDLHTCGVVWSPFPKMVQFC